MNASSVQRRLRRAAARGAHRVLGRVEPPPPPPEPPPRKRGLRWHEPLPQQLGVERGGATQALLARLEPGDVAAVEARIAGDPELQALYDEARGVHRPRLQLALGMHFGIEGIAERTGLTSAAPPDDIHVMARGPLAAAGGLYEADLVTDALAGVGVDIADLRSALDFGCSSGRVVRVLACAYPDVAWHACDPNGPAIAWARDAIPGVGFFRSDDEPPLDLPDASLDCVYAISIWSHFNPILGLRWLDEMRRVVRPGGHLVMTTHGATTIAHDVANRLRPPDQGQEIARAIGETGSWYHSEFGPEGDWGVVNPDWGTAFLSAEWVLAHLCPAWHVLDFAPGRNAFNQDVWVLRRV
jgi:SAM-dependent methyltransferase